MLYVSLNGAQVTRTHPTHEGTLTVPPPLTLSTSEAVITMGKAATLIKIYGDSEVVCPSKTSKQLHTHISARLGPEEVGQGS